MEKHCLNCDSPFEAKPSEIKRGNGKFCSRGCAGSFNGKKKLAPNVTCAYCGKKFHKAQNRIGASKSGFVFCCRAHKDLAQKSENFKAMWPSHYGTGNGIRSYRAKALKEFGAVCNRCGYKENIAAITVHHKDNNRMNNSIKNLEVLCANCHCIEHWATGVHGVLV